MSDVSETYLKRIYMFQIRFRYVRHTPNYRMTHIDILAYAWRLSNVLFAYGYRMIGVWPAYFMFSSRFMLFPTFTIFFIKHLFSFHFAFYAIFKKHTKLIRHYRSFLSGFLSTLQHTYISDNTTHGSQPVHTTRYMQSINNQTLQIARVLISKPVYFIKC